MCHGNVFLHQYVCIVFLIIFFIRRFIILVIIFNGIKNVDNFVQTLEFQFARSLNEIFDWLENDCLHASQFVNFVKFSVGPDVQTKILQNLMK